MKVRRTALFIQILVLTVKGQGKMSCFLIKHFSTLRLFISLGSLSSLGSRTSLRIFWFYSFHWQQMVSVYPRNISSWMWYSGSNEEFTFGNKAVFHFSHAHDLRSPWLMSLDFWFLTQISQEFILNYLSPDFLTNNNLGGCLLPLDLHRNMCGCICISLPPFSRNLR